MHFFSFLTMITLISAQIEEINQIINGLPHGQLNVCYPYNIEGWSCTLYCQIQDCQATSSFYPQINGTSLECTGNVMDINSQCNNQEITQFLNLSVNHYWLSIDYLYPQQRATQKQMQITFNDEVIFFIVQDVSVSIEKYQILKKIQAKDGINVLRIKSSGLNDCYGFKIANISLNRQIDAFQQGTLSSLFKSQILQKSKAVPGGRVFLFSLLSFMVNFDRLQFYLYHNRQYSKNSKNLLQKIKSLQSAKGNFVELEIRQHFPIFINFLDRVFSYSQIKKKYISYNVDDESQRYFTLSDYIHYSLAFSIPIVVCIFFSLHIIFRLLQKWSISMVFRPYAFYATLVFALLEGNIESITFYCFKEFQIFCSFSFQHKLLNLLSISILFFLFFFCFGFCLILKFCYQRKAKFMINTEKSTLPSVLSTTFDRGMIIFSLGAIHQLLLASPKIQMAALISIELLWPIEKIIARKQFLNLLFFLVSLLESLLRIYFQTTCSIYSQFEDLKFEINNQYHFYLIFGFLGVLALNFVCNTIFLLINFIMSRIFRKNRVKSNKMISNEKSNHQQFNIIYESHIKPKNIKLKQRKRNVLSKEKNDELISNDISTIKIIPNENNKKIEKGQFKKLKRIMFQIVFTNEKYHSNFSSLQKR